MNSEIGSIQEVPCQPGDIMEWVNNKSSGVELTLVMGDGTKVTAQLAPGQRIRLEPVSHVQVYINDGDPAGLHAV